MTAPVQHGSITGPRGGSLMQKCQMTKSEDNPQSDRLEEAIVLLTQLSTPAPKSW